ncbi:hypothetical protein Trydic_g20798 [Trypoxylus dichotomus]
MMDSILIKYTQQQLYHLIYHRRLDPFLHVRATVEGNVEKNGMQLLMALFIGSKLAAVVLKYQDAAHEMAEFV